jgi:predicted TIM-barrel fold metal-dependent hydrolase
MGMPTDLGIIDTMIAFPIRDKRKLYSFITKQTKDASSKGEMDFPVEYMFKDVPDELREDEADPVALTLREMDRWGVEIGLIGAKGADAERALRDHPDRFVGGLSVDPNRGMDAIRDIRKAHETFGIRAVDIFPAGTFPQVAINDKKMYPIYATCVELGIPVFVCAGIPGPRVPFACQHVELIDEVMFDFPELVFVTRHGCEPWTDLAVKLMLKWPNLHYCTSAFAPKYYPKAIIDYANTRGADRIFYAGYFPMGLSLERIMTEMPNVGFKDDVWPKFLRGNAARVLKLDL